jgi:hypothetical protein
MSIVRNITSGLRSLFRKEQVSDELDEELNGFLEMAAEEKMKEGMSRKDAGCRTLVVFKGTDFDSSSSSAPFNACKSPFNPEIRPFNVYSLLTSLLGCYRSPCLARSPTKSTTSRRRIITTHYPLLTTHFSPPFVFITLRILPPACLPTSIFISIIFMHLQIPFPAKPLFSHPYKTPGVSPTTTPRISDFRAEK